MSVSNINAAVVVADRRPLKNSSKSAEYYLAVLVLVTSVFQLYLIPIGSLYISIGLISAYMASIYLLFAIRHRIDRYHLSFGALFGLQALSIVWSVDRFAGLRDIIFGVPFFACFLLGRRLCMAHEKQALLAVKLFCLLGLVQTTLLILFRLVTSIESSFLHSDIVALFVSPNALEQFFGGQANNIADPDKAGGLLLNANVAGVWAATMAFMAMAISRISENSSDRWFWFLVAAAHVCGVLACGSKASLLLLFLSPLIATVALRYLELRSYAVRLLFFLSFVALTVVLVELGRFLVTETEFGRRALFATATRLLLWKFAVAQFAASPWLGLGYGGWQAELAKFAGGLDTVGLSYRFPPHNSLIILWSNSGVFAAILGLAIVFLLFQTAASPSGSGKRGKGLAFWSICVVAFFYLQSMGENYGLLGEPHIQAPFAFFLGVVTGYAVSDKAIK
jgi:O-antigen ligase